MSTYDSEARARNGRLGAQRQHELHDPRETTRAARAAFLRRFDHEADPSASWRAYFRALAAKSAEVRAVRAKAGHA